ncbi:hypothetical protein [Streptomyces mesophilus]|uniref:hypothetical protein n=1 Tax=Streptomyces mesophilus TaxID=1775132 RepID=UPI0033219F34
MRRRNRYGTAVAATGLALALAAGLTGAAAADGGGAGKKRDAVTQTDKKKGDDGQWLARLAERYGVGEEALQNALRAVKAEFGEKGTEPTGLALATALASRLDISQKKAEQLVRELFAKGPVDRGPGKEGHGKKGPAERGPSKKDPGKRTDSKPVPGKPVPGKPGSGKPGSGKAPADDAKLTEAFVQALVDKLGVSREQAAAAFATLEKLSATQDGVDPRSEEFAALARGLKVTPERLEQVLIEVKRSLAQDVEGSPKTYKG